MQEVSKIILFFSFRHCYIMNDIVARKNHPDESG